MSISAICIFYSKQQVISLVSTVLKVRFCLVCCAKWDMKSAFSMSSACLPVRLEFEAMWLIFEVVSLFQETRSSKPINRSIDYLTVCYWVLIHDGMICLGLRIYSQQIHHFDRMSRYRLRVQSSFAVFLFFRERLRVCLSRNVWAKGRDTWAAIAYNTCLQKLATFDRFLSSQASQLVDPMQHFVVFQTRKDPQQCFIFSLAFKEIHQLLNIIWKAVTLIDIFFK